MTRPRFQRSLRFDNLEGRQLLSGVATQPTAEQQYMLYMLNQARTNPQETAQHLSNLSNTDLAATLNYYHVDLNATTQAIASTPAKPPLAWNSNLAASAQGHSQDMVNNQYQSHTGSDGSTANQRMQAAGYGNASSMGENAYAYADSVDQAMDAFLVDWGVSDQGHRRNILQPNVSSGDAYREVGIGIASSSGSSKVGPLVITQDFGSQSGAKAQLVGVAYNDGNGDGSYSLGEGQGNVQIDATNLSTGRTTTTQSWGAGGYQMALDPGKYQVTASVNGKVVKTGTVSIGGDNVEQDFDLSDSWDGRSRDQVIASVTPSNNVATIQTAATVAASVPTVQTVSIPTAKTFVAAKSATTPSLSGSWTSWMAQKA
ncbi:Cysteine-rich secretory protein family protein [Aquisphaera giovannonii]|uniref:Cysteine-rich secretory protein family protein n=1 Tax=Aquisphaera giovannonii TaxID=406548 RepID=A0A5B9W8V7_9BACT|nr:CAP domain-containing protein [Aquisphaera giovannonii]QEH36827.1 Cysteine-rich secretory protein family protein [Aquisphaera giovannonii]